MDWVRAHFPSYSAIRSSASSLASSMSSHSNGTTQERRHSSQARNVPRVIVVNSPIQPRKYCGNEISTCKYNVLTFLPRFLIEQFRRYSNVFFLCIAILQQIPGVSPTGRYTTAVPFLIILTVSALKEIFEDIKRRRMDNEVNNYKVEVLKPTGTSLSSWKELHVGEIIKVTEGHHFPADVVILSSSESMGMAYIETAQLDGETNLKIRQSLLSTADFTTEQLLRKLRAEIECEPPNRKVNEFTGTLRLGSDRFPLSITQLLLRGAKLKNCKWIYGVVVYAGHDSRLLMNSTTAPLKNSRIDQLTNRRIVFLFLMLVFITIVSVIGAEIVNHYGSLSGDPFYLHGLDRWSFLWNLLTFFILYNNLIPISLQVTLEVVRFFQASYINQDLLMYDEASDTPATARTSNLNEELGQVQFLMTDKTGTLTRNIMTFKRCHVGQVEYGDDDREDFDDPALLRDMHSNGKGNAALIREFLTMMATCHTVVPERDPDNNERIRFQAASPDEGALVRGAQNQGFVFHTRKPNEVAIQMDSGDHKFKLLNVLEFNSDRKRMSVILRDGNGRIKLFCKGADNVIFERLSHRLNNAELLNSSQQALIEYAHKGYRTLCFAAADLDPATYQHWAQEFEEASTSIENREQKVATAAEKIERDLRLVGVTAIEDKLQENVPQTIRTLLEAGIHIWMLTGDKLETAVEIAQSSSLCSLKTEFMILAERNYDSVLGKLQHFTLKSRHYLEMGVEFALVIDGASLHHAVIAEARRTFAELIINCHSVICCRMTPMQKAEIVEIVKILQGNQTVMAVGDGANDVAMIQAANVGVGISGVEGLQAASASDYSIAQFQYLQRLILVHGTWNFERSVKVILYSFYKNICLYIIELWFAFFSAFTGVTIFERWTIATFNVAFTALPPIILGLFDRPISQRVMLRNPSLYQSFQSVAFSNQRFFLWIGVSIWHSLVLFFLAYGFYSPSGILWSNGRTGGWLMFGNSLYTFVVATVCLKALLECDSWTWTIVGSCIGSILLWFIFLAVYSRVWSVFPHFGAEMSGMFMLMVASPAFWMALVFIAIATLLFDFVVKSLCTSLMPSPRERFCLREKRRTLIGCNITDLAGNAGNCEVRQSSEEEEDQRETEELHRHFSSRSQPAPLPDPPSPAYFSRQQSHPPIAEQTHFQRGVSKENPLIPLIKQPQRGPDNTGRRVSDPVHPTRQNNLPPPEHGTSSSSSSSAYSPSAPNEHTNIVPNPNFVCDYGALVGAHYQVLERDDGERRVQTGSDTDKSQERVYFTRKQNPPNRDQRGSTELSPPLLLDLQSSV